MAKYNGDHLQPIHPPACRHRTEECSGYEEVLDIFTVNSLCAGTKNLAEILSDRESIALTMQAGLDEATDPWGVKVERVEM